MKPNHKDGCDGQTWRHSGDGYNRVRVCACGAEDHDPTPESLKRLRDFVVDGIANAYMDALRKEGQ